MNYRDEQIGKMENLIKTSSLFNKDSGNGEYRKKPRPFVLKKSQNNFFNPIFSDVINYFSKNKISWWGGLGPSGHTLSSQVSCLNHLFYIRKDKDAVLKIAKNIFPEIEDIFTISTDKFDAGYIQFEAISTKDNLNEGQLTRGSNCTSVDALIYGLTKGNKKILFPIEWKYTESYGNTDKSIEDGEGSQKGSERKGKERLKRYSKLIDESKQLKSFSEYRGSIYFFEPFYQLMRQTLWAEQIIKHKRDEILEVDDFIHIHVVPQNNKSLLKSERGYKKSNKDMEKTWRDCINDQSKYRVVSPEIFTGAIDNQKYGMLIKYLKERYW
jgi:hypothetical protein